MTPAVFRRRTLQVAAAFATAFIVMTLLLPAGPVLSVPAGAVVPAGSSLGLLPAAVLGSHRPAPSVPPAALRCTALSSASCRPHPGLRAASSYLGSASAAFPEVGTVLANLSVSLPGGPAIEVVDPWNGWLYLSAAGGHDVTAVNGTSVVGTANVSSSIGGLAVDPSNGTVFVLNNQSDSVTLLSGLSPTGTIAVGLDPNGAAWDPATGLLYVSNCQSNNVSILNSTAVVATDRADLCPGPPLYDPANGYVYVPNEGANDVTILNGSSTVATVANLAFSPGRLSFDPESTEIVAIGYPGESGGGFAWISGTSLAAQSQAGSSTGGMAVNPISGWVYLTDPAGGTVYAMNGTSVEGTFSGLTQPGAAVFDPASGQVFVAGPGSGHVASVLYTLRGLVEEGSIDVPNAPTGFAINPAFPWIDSLEPSNDIVSLVSTVLSVTPTQVTPAGVPNGTTEQGNSVAFDASLSGIGTSIGNVASTVVPSSGLSCPVISEQDTYLYYVSLFLNCTASVAGNYTVQFNISDTFGGRVWSNAAIRVYPLVEAGPPGLVPGPATGVHGALVNRTATFEEAVTGGSGILTSYAWSGLPPEYCVALGTASPQCVFPAPLSLNVSVTVVDSDGGRSTSPIVEIQAYDPLVAGALRGNRTSTDVGQSVLFSAAVSGGVGTVTYTWSGVPSAECPSLTSAEMFCLFDAANIYSISLVVADSIGETIVLGPLSFTVYPLPSAAAPTVSRTTADVNQSFEFRAVASGGTGTYSFDWVGLPDWCLGTQTAVVTCLPQSPGIVTGQVRVNDSNGVGAVPSAPVTALVSSDPQIVTSVLSPPTVVAGSPWSFTLEMQGGYGPYTVNWSGLPPGCSSTTPSVSCSPNVAGKYLILGQVTDANGYLVYFNGATVTVLPPPAAAPTGFLAELPAGWEYMVAAAAGVIGLAVAGVTLVRVRRGPSRPADRRRAAPDPIERKDPRTEESPPDRGA